MFAVPGWSVSADALKPETSSAKAGSGPSASKSRKRKRGNGPGAESQNVTAANVADLYESVVEGRGEVEGKAKGKAEGNKASGDDTAAPAKRMRKKESSAASGSASALTPCPHLTAESKKGKGKTKTKTKNNEASSSKQGNKDKDDEDGNKGKRAKGQNESLNEDTPVVSTQDEGNSKPSDASSSARASKLDGTAAQSSLPPAPSKLTPLQASMREKLISARFRHLNETLYTKPSAEAFGLFQDSPEMFDEYHEGFRRQVKVWPENPVDSFLSDIRSRAKARPPPTKGRPGPPPPPPPSQQRSNKMALPRTMGTCTIADLGCGDARLAASLQKESAKLRLDIKSFDLQSLSPLVTKADIANLPLEDGSVNIAIFCLALMGTNWIDFVEEAYRVLHWKGELWVAEIKSRFGPARNKAVVEHSVGNRKKNNVALSKKAKLAQAAQAGALHGEDLAVEVDGSEDRRRETDVTPFIEALQKRGFILQGERAEAVDLSNRMFVKMHFIKGASPTKGKGVRQLQGDKVQGQLKKKRGFAPKWDEGEAKDEDENEASILKPCVYKIR